MARVPLGGDGELPRVALNVEDDGHAGRPALLLLHGFTGSLEDFDEVAPALRRRARVLAVDLPGHGRSDAPDDAAAYAPGAVAGLLLRLLDVAKVPRASVLGYSLGARVAMRLALDRPARVARLVLEGATPGIEDPVERARRREEDAALVRVLETAGVAKFVDLWMSRPHLAGSEARLGASANRWAREDRLKRDPVGLARTLEAAGQGATEPLWGRLGELRTPTRLVVGEEDAKYREIAGRMAARMPRADVAVVPGALHAPHRERPAGFLDAVVPFLEAP